MPTLTQAIAASAIDDGSGTETKFQLRMVVVFEGTGCRRGEANVCQIPADERGDIDQSESGVDLPAGAVLSFDLGGRER